MYPDDAELQAIRNMVRDQIRAGVEFLAAAAFFIVIAFFWVGTP